MAVNWQDELTLATFKRYFKRGVGEGPFTLQYDKQQLEHVRKLVEIWQRVIGEHAQVNWEDGLNAARDEPGYVVDRSHVNEVRIAYNAAMEELHTS
jgi:hypothetical protein